MQSTSLGLAPFCGAKVRAAPRGPQKGLSTSQSRMMRHLRQSGETADVSMFAIRRKSQIASATSHPALSKKRRRIDACYAMKLIDSIGYFAPHTIQKAHTYTAQQAYASVARRTAAKSE